MELRVPRASLVQPYLATYDLRTIFLGGVIPKKNGEYLFIRESLLLMADPPT